MSAHIHTRTNPWIRGIVGGWKAQLEAKERCDTFHLVPNPRLGANFAFLVWFLLFQFL